MENRISILLVEDNEVDIMYFKRQFDMDREDFFLNFALNGHEALEMLNELPEKNHPDLILLDIYMPVMDGLSFLKKLRSCDDLKVIPVIVLTSSKEEENRIRAYNLNVAGYIEKPTLANEFSVMMETLKTYLKINQFPV